jgi:hypothetical protein
MNGTSSLNRRLYFLLNMAMVIMYAIGGIVLFFWHIPSIPDSNRYILSGVLFLYAIYRGVNLARKYKRIAKK